MSWAEDGFTEQDEDRIISVLEDYETIKEHIIKVAEKVATYNDYGHWDIDEDEIEIASPTVRFQVFMWRCGGRDYESFNFPLSYLWDDNWEEEEEAAMKSREEAKKKKEEERKQKKLAKIEAREKAQLEHLKAKYEPNDEAKYVLEQMKEKTGATIISHKEDKDG